MPSGGKKRRKTSGLVDSLVLGGVNQTGDVDTDDGQIASGSSGPRQRRTSDGEIASGSSGPRQSRPRDRDNHEVISKKRIRLTSPDLTAGRSVRFLNQRHILAYLTDSDSDTSDDESDSHIVELNGRESGWLEEEYYFDIPPLPD